MHSSLFMGAAALLLPLVSGQNSTGPDAAGKYWVYGEGISAAFIPYGASISNLIIKDQYGIDRDIVGGFDNASYCKFLSIIPLIRFTPQLLTRHLKDSIDKQHPHFGGVPGRYANRIKNSTFEIDGVTYNVTPNENPTPEAPEGADTLHGGLDGWDWRNFTVESYTTNSITFSIVDPDGKEGFPGEVISYITYSLGDMTWDFKMVAIATTKKTPIMLSSHTYWNLDGFANNETQTVFNHSLFMPYSGQRVDVDNILIPTGDILANQPDSVNDFWSAPKQIGANISSPELEGNCGFNCTGYGKFLYTCSCSWSLSLDVPTAADTHSFPSAQILATSSTASKTDPMTGAPTAATSPACNLLGPVFSSTCTATRKPTSSTVATARTDLWHSRRRRACSTMPTSRGRSPSMGAW